MIAVWFSCGAASAVAAKKTIEIYGKDHEIRVINNPVKEEHEDNMRFLKDVEKWLGVKIEFAINPKFPSASAYDVWEKKKYMSGVLGAPCTLELKKKARQHWEENNKADYNVLGFTFDEAHRHKRFTERERDNVLPVLIDLKITKADCFKIIKEAGIKLPEIYSLGYPNANCIGCVKSTSISYWQLVRNVHPQIFKERSEQSRRIGCKLIQHKRKRIFLDEIPEDAKGGKLKNLNFDCGIFCEEKF
jgi:3'-phosphoadenosine 5'-phosphosulfate sulfotransferase (PAPS reductase)/FAD synthetase